MSVEAKAQKISVTRALAELKLLSSRITKLQDETVFVSLKVKGKHWEDHTAQTKTNFDKIRDLLKYRQNLKFAIISSNANTRVKIAGTNYTVAEAIAKKELLDLERHRLSAIRNQRQQVERDLAEHEKQTQIRLDTMARENKSKSSGQEMTDLNNAFLAANKAEIVDPLKSSQLIAELDNEISEFEKEVDLVLSESNAVTLLSVCP
jgi:hypothetical protein